MFTIFLFSFCLSTFRPDHSVSLSVVAPWYEVPLYEQLLFYIADQSTSSAISFLQETLKSIEKIDNSSYLWEKAESSVTPDAVSLMKAQIESGFFLPRAEMYREIARQIGGSNYSDLFTTGCNDLSIKSDYSYPSNMTSYYMHDILIGPNQTTCYVYANLHNSTVAENLLQLIESGISFILRPTSKTAKFGIKLRGFGIEMRPFKYSMEYGVKDSIIQDTQNKGNSSLNDETIGEINEIPPSYTDPSQFASIGVKLASFLRQQTEPLTKVLRDVSSNYPLYLSKICSSSQEREDINSFLRVNRISLPEDTFSMINGRAVPLKNLDIFTLLDIINQEKNFRTILESHFRMDLPLVKAISSASLVEPGEYIVDYRSDVIVYFNNFEKDPEYSSYSTNINDMFSIFSGMPYIKKNLVNVVFIGNLISLDGFKVLTNLVYFLQQQLPIRIGVVPYFNLNDKLSRKVCFAFHHLSLHNQKAAIQFILEAFILTDTKNEGKLPSEKDFAYYYTKQANLVNKKYQVIESKEKVVDWNSIHTLYDSNSKEFQNIIKTHEYLQKIGFKNDVVLMNGKIIKKESILTQNFILDYQQCFQNIQQIFYQKGYHKLPLTDIFDIMSEFSTVVPSIDVRVLDETPIGLGLIHQSLSHQLSFAEYLNEIEWDSRDKGIIASFFILFCPNETNVELFKTFMNMNHSVPTAFAINPPFPESIMKIDRSKITLISNGRIFADFELNDINKLVMVDVWNKNCVYNSIKKHVNSIRYKRSEAILYLSCIFTDWVSETITREKTPDNIFQITSSLNYRSFSNNNGLHWDLVINPFTREFQRMANIIYYIDKLKVIDLRLIILPPEDLAEPTQITTVSTYYRNALSSDYCLFTYLNDTTTYSSMPDMPTSWIFESMKASVDLDNILLKELSPGNHEGIYILTNVMTEGICYTNKGEYAEGAELALINTNSNERKSDTIVMMSNGYWQLPANPGRYKIELGGKRSKMVYEMCSNEIIVSTFSTIRRNLLVRVNEGMEGLKVYNISIPDTSNTTRVDVFSVASGHLYERLLKIMMLSVRRRSQFNVKFWIIKAFLSPQFKATLPIMSQKYNFSYQLVSYKWPTWLRPQYEKQRIIWGNKILFLDVIFPLDLERVIYVDSDQIVRTDLIELMRMNFGDAPYAFTPFCNSRKETEKFRFWKQGYWKDLLGTKKYHISALFAIDLIKFRQMAAGDWLRYHYQTLSADPGSLANLDQDLPNFAQTHIPIFSLPQNWLWCETWCSDETMKDAKTIDLCNNPLTKKPKLFVAQTMVKEWPGLDEEARNISSGPDDYIKYFFNNTN